MATRVLFRRGDATQHDSNKGDGSGFTGSEGEITVDTTNDTIRVHDGLQVGGHRLAKFSEIGTTITTADESSDATSFPVFTTAATGILQPKTDESAYTYNASNGTLTATTFVGALSGNATTATTATNVVVTDNESTSENNAIVFVANADLDGSTSTGLESDGDLTYNPSTGTVTATGFSGNLTGTIQTAAQTNITSVGDLTALNVNGTVTADGLTLGFDESIILGDFSGGDYLQISHSSSSNDVTIKEEGNGQLKIQGAHIQLQTPSSASYAEFNNSGSVDLYWRGTSAGKRLETTQNGIGVTGTVTADGLVMGDDERIKLGDGTDFQIYHENSTNKSIIKESNASANLQIQGENINITRTDASKSFIQTFDNKDVALYSDGNIKLRTSDGTGSFAAGVNVTGTVTADGLAIDGDSVINGEVDIQHEHKVRFKQSDESTDQLVIKTSGTNSFIQESGGGHLYITGDRILLQESSSSTDRRINIGDNNGVKIYGDDKLRIATGNGTLNGADLANNIHFYTGDGDAADHRTMLISATGIDVTGTVTADSFILEDGSGNKTTLAENASGDITLTLPSSAGTLALTSDITVTASSTTTLTNKSISGEQIDSGTIAAARVATLNQDTTGNAATATIAKGAAVTYDASNDGAIDHATVAGFVGKTVVYTNTGDGNDLTLGLPDVGVDISIGEQIHLVNASSGSGSSALIILDLSESGTGQTVNICTGATVLSNTGSADPHIVAGGVATLVATADNTYVLFGSGVVDN